MRLRARASRNGTRSTRGWVGLALAGWLMAACVHHAPAHGVHGRNASNASRARTAVFRAGTAAVPEDSPFPAQHLLTLSDEACRTKLAHVPLEVRTSGTTRGVREPYRLRGSVDGLAFRPSWPARSSDPSMEVVDCRLILALADAAPIFHRHGVKGIVYLSAYRPPAGDLEASLRKSRHGAGMALDVGMLERVDGARWDVAKDFPKALGRPPCEERQAEPEPGSSEDLRALVCDLAVSGLFSVVLTPNYNDAHHDHVHVELNPRVPSVYLR